MKIYISASDAKYLIKVNDTYNAEVALDKSGVDYSATLDENDGLGEYRVNSEGLAVLDSAGISYRIVSSIEGSTKIQASDDYPDGQTFYVTQVWLPDDKKWEDIQEYDQWKDKWHYSDKIGPYSDIKDARDDGYKARIIIRDSAGRQVDEFLGTYDDIPC